jgi:hypothetical protein
MNKTLSLALAATAIAATSTSFISAEAGGRCSVPLPLGPDGL